MKKYLLIIGLIISSYAFGQEHYAILISAGDVANDDFPNHSEYWYDLFLAYEDLILNENYTHENIYVFYGEGAGDDFNSSHQRYNISLHNWSGIVDYDNSYETMNEQFDNIADIITAEDNLLIRWICGHGGPGTDADDYATAIQNEIGDFIETIDEVDLINMIDKISNYKRRKIIWMTCFSGCLVYGNHHLRNNKTTIITSSDWDEGSNSYCPYCTGGNCDTSCIHQNVSCELNWVITSSLFGEDPLGDSFNGDHNSDNVISMDDLYVEASGSSIMSSTPQIADDGSLKSRIYINENLTLENVNLTGYHSYRTESITIRNVNFQNNANIVFQCDEDIVLENDFEIETGSTLTIYD